MMPIKEDDLEYLKYTRALSKDGQGRATLVGLTYEQTDEYLLLLDPERAQTLRIEDRDRERDRYLELHEVHEQARLAVIEAEVALRTTSPTKH